MATGIKVDKIDSLKLEILDSIETVNKLVSRLNSCRTTIQANIEGAGATEIIGKLDFALAQISKVKANFNSYISSFGSVVRNYENQDTELASTVVKDIDKI